MAFIDIFKDYLFFVEMPSKKKKNVIETQLKWQLYLSD